MPDPARETSPLLTIPQPEVAFEGKLTLGEGPLYDPTSGHLFFVEIKSGQLFCSENSSTVPQDCTMVPYHQELGFVALSGEHNLLLGLEREVVSIDWTAPTTRGLCVPLPDSEKAGNFINDAAVDRNGNLLFGTKDLTGETGQANLYRLTPDGNVTRLISSLTISNGIAFNDELKLMYLIDSPSKAVFTYSLSDDSSVNFVTLFKTDDAPGVPDGMTIDNEGYLWICHYGGSCISRWHPGRREMVQKVDIPTALNITSCTFSGPNLNDLVITTAKQQTEPADAYPNAGDVFIIKDMPVHGFAPHRFGQPATTSLKTP